MPSCSHGCTEDVYWTSKVLCDVNSVHKSLFLHGSWGGFGCKRGFAKAREYGTAVVLLLVGCRAFFPLLLFACRLFSRTTRTWQLRHRIMEMPRHVRWQNKHCHGCDRLR